ncbi:MAG: orotidine-5'-phosphate decarboxylase [Candidatus Eisenbacteria bacterium]
MGGKRIAVALDGLSDRQALGLADRLGKRAGSYKVGLELYTRYGPGLPRRLGERGLGVFLDLKFHDIPATVCRAVGAACWLGPSFLTVHASGGPEMLRRAVEGRGESPTRLLAVTVLTSEGGRGVARRAERLAVQAFEAGFDGVVASAREVERIKSLCGNEFIVVVPGIRQAVLPGDDQKRTATPAEAIRAGADLLVIGRPITRAEDPREAFEAIAAEIRNAR